MGGVGGGKPEYGYRWRLRHIHGDRRGMLCRPVHEDARGKPRMAGWERLTVEFADGFRVQASRFAIKRVELRPGTRPLIRVAGWRRPPQLERKRIPRKLASKSIDYAPGYSQVPSLHMMLLVGGQPMKLWEAAQLLGVQGRRVWERLNRGMDLRTAFARATETAKQRG